MMKVFISKRCPIVINSTENIEEVIENVVTDGVQRKVSKKIPFKGNDSQISYKAYSPDLLIQRGETSPIKTFIGTSIAEQIDAVKDFNDRLGSVMEK